MGRQPAIHLLPHWNWPNRVGQKVPVECYSNAEEVELLQDGSSLGRKPIAPYASVKLDVVYHPGKLDAVGYRGGKEIARTSVETTDAPAALQLIPHWPSLRANGRDVAVVDVAVVDGKGRLVPDANLPVTFQISGPGRILGAGNGDPACHEQEAFTPEVKRDPPASIAGWEYKVVSTQGREWWDSWTRYTPTLDQLDESGVGPRRPRQRRLRASAKDDGRLPREIHGRRRTAQERADDPATRRLRPGSGVVS